ALACDVFLLTWRSGRHLALHSFPTRRSSDLVDLQLEPLALADPGEASEAETRQRTGHRLALRVEDLGFGHDLHDDMCHRCGLLFGGGRSDGSILPGSAPTPSARSAGRTVSRLPRPLRAAVGP